MVCWGIDRTTLDCVQFVNARVKKLGLSAEALRPDGEVAKSCDNLLMSLEAVMGSKTTTNAQRFMLLHSLGAYREQIVLVMRSQNVRLYDDRYQNYQDDDESEDSSSSSEDDMDDIGRRDHNADRPRVQQQADDGYRNVTRHNNNQTRGGNRGAQDMPAPVPFQDTLQGRGLGGPEPEGGYRVLQLTFNPADYYGRLMRVHYVFNENDMTINSKFGMADKEREAAFAAAKHLRSTYQDIGINGAPKSSALVRFTDNAHDGVLPVCDVVWGGMRLYWNNRGSFVSNTTREVNATADINVDLIVGVNYDDPRSYRPNYDHTSWYL